ncbi:MAG TPA: hypothetical protein VJV74_08820, partial [Terriglobia bacterium]|nr:hypothetical protein [Terriglobia bacterium]
RTVSRRMYSIPDSQALNRILKYQALNDRRLQRALSQLERLQLGQHTLEAILRGVRPRPR